MSPLGPGLLVEVVDGDAKGQQGVIVGRWPRDFACRLPHWIVRLGPDERPIRADYLRGVS